jgi:hypothetical protein
LRLMRFAEHQSPHVRQLAHRALSKYAHGEVRRLAFERVGAVPSELPCRRRTDDRATAIGSR